MNDTVLDLWIVDDEPAMCLGVTRSLEDYSAVYDDLGEAVRYNVTAMESGEALLERLDRQPAPQLLLLDGKLPGIDGIEVMRLLSERRAPIVTIMITAYATLENAVKATKLGAFDFLAKPFTPAELRHTVGKAARQIILTRRAQQLEQEKRQVRFQFLSVLAHELKSPLAAIEGYVDMLRQGSVDPAVLDRMEARTQGMRKLIADLLDLTAIESGRRRRDLQDLDLCAVARDVVTHLEAPAKAKDIKVLISAAAACLCRVDRSEMEMLMRNLVSNAIKYNVPGGRVTVDIAATPAGVHLSVADTGIGISAADQAKLFAEFSRVKNNRTRGIEGSGLGLSIVRRLAALYGGTVTVASEENKGSTFTVVWPAKP